MRQLEHKKIRIYQQNKRTLPTEGVFLLVVDRMPTTGRHNAATTNKPLSNFAISK